MSTLVLSFLNGSSSFLEVTRTTISLNEFEFLPDPSLDEIEIRQDLTWVYGLAALECLRKTSIDL